MLSESLHWQARLIPKAVFIESESRTFDKYAPVATRGAIDEHVEAMLDAASATPLIRQLIKHFPILVVRADEIRIRGRAWDREPHRIMASPGAAKPGKSWHSGLEKTE